MKRVLVISYYWPPTGGSGVQRWVKFSKYFPRLGWQPVIYTPLNPEQLAVDTSLLQDVPPQAEIIRTHISEPYGIYRRLKAGKESGAGVNLLNAQHKTLKQKLAVWIRGNFFIPDPRVFWVRPSVKYLVGYLREHPVDVIVTTGPPHSIHLIGRGVMRRLRTLGGRLPAWIADFRDPWTEMFYFKHMGLSPLSKRIHRRLEQSVLDECDTVVAVSPPVGRDFAGRTGTAVRLITNGFDEDDFSGTAMDPSLFEDKFVLAHTGLFASDGNPLKIWELLSCKCSLDASFAEKLRIVLSGKTDREITDSIIAAGLKDNLVDMGYLPHYQTVALQKRADVLMLPLRREPEYAKVLPGKIFEYLASGRPVLGTGQPGSAACAVLEDAGAGHMYDWDDIAGPDDFIGREYSMWLEGVRPRREEDISKYSRRNLAADMVALMEELS